MSSVIDKVLKEIMAERAARIEARRRREREIAAEFPFRLSMGPPFIQVAHDERNDIPQDVANWLEENEVSFHHNERHFRFKTESDALLYQMRWYEYVSTC
ncbi:hypothetical protein [Methylobacterium nodulans]|uniref:Uncharacterized protein n=1 Tax=Methylobacterium nodulans (strain LMG 21967 / CNCM I-2342 / ORS 2060) TaxID=460265 RepID=B8IXZ8_METNO|nr:hypothetical protein [Methylobacterium nodulans]ACL63288.1 hypothetical protein Mnod_7694 [Methylobacterium nodulans ORS 2060]